MDSNPDIPIIEVSTFQHENMPMHVKMGEALAPLREEGILIIGSGSAVHNLRTLWNYQEKSPQFVKDFDDDMAQIATKLTGEERNAKANELNKHKHFRDCHPTAEHLMPYHVALGAAGQDTGKKLLHDYFSTLSWGSYAFGLPEEPVLPKYDGTQTRDEL